jgi:SagB-type dehydrogenase family enzyme
MKNGLPLRKFNTQKQVIMKQTFLTVLFICLSIILMGQNPQTIHLEPPDLKRGLPVLEALSLRASATEFDTASLSLRDLSDLLWAANGINRPESGKRTAPSAMNAQDIDLYVFMEPGVYLYDPKSHSLNSVAEGDHRISVVGKQKHFAQAPVMCVLVSDISRFPTGDEAKRMVWAAEDAGIVSQNISIFCASVGLATRPRASMDIDTLREILNLTDDQRIMLNHPVSNQKK